MSSPTRIYRINDGKADRLIRAASQAQAVRHVASGFAVRVATQDDIANLVGGGVRVETAGAEPAQPVNQMDEE